MKLRLSKIGKIVIAISLLLVVTIILLVYYNYDKKGSVHKMESNEFYDIKIDYDKTGIKVIDKQIANFVDEKKDDFIAIVDKSGMVETSKYNLIISATNVEYKNVNSVHLLAYAYTGGAHYTREDKSLVYDQEKKTYLSFVDILVSNGFEEIKPLILESIYTYAQENNVILNDEWVLDGTSYSEENYQNFYLAEDGLNIIFPPYQIATWADGEIKISIPYEKLEGILKSEYMSNSSTSIDSIIDPNDRDLEQFKDKKLIAFTFDDGPNTKTTSRLLDGLSEYDAKVTFFVLGSRVDSNKDVLKRAYEEGNQIGIHTYNHLNLLLLDDASVLSEINSTNSAVEEAIGIRPTLLRPPYGNINEHIKSLANMHIINWDVDTEDWKLKDRNLIKDKILADAHDGAIVLLHDIYTESVEGALLAMEELEKENYAFVTIEEMIQLRGVKLDYETTYYNFLKE